MYTTDHFAKQFSLASRILGILFPALDAECMFKVTLNTHYMCNNCQFHGDKPYSLNHIPLHVNSPNQTSVGSMLYDFQLSENLDTDYACDNCHCKGSTTKTDLRTSTSQIFILTLKAFQFDLATLSASKKNSLLLLKMNLNVNGKWRLIGVVLHEGAATNTGHYSAVVNTGTGKQCNWFSLNDTIATPCSAPTHFLVTDDSLPYIIFYEKVDEPETSLSQEHRRKAFSRIETIRNNH